MWTTFLVCLSQFCTIWSQSAIQPHLLLVLHISPPLQTCLMDPFSKYLYFFIKYHSACYTLSSFLLLVANSHALQVLSQKSPLLWNICWLFFYFIPSSFLNLEKSYSSFNVWFKNHLFYNISLSFLPSSSFLLLFLPPLSLSIFL